MYVRVFMYLCMYMYVHILDYIVRGYNLWLYVYTKCVYVYKTTVFINNVNVDIYLHA